MFIDDERFPTFLEGKHWPYKSTRNIPDEFIIVRTVEDAKKYIKEHGYPSFISFDNDLGYESEEGYKLVHWLIDMDLDYNWMTKDFNWLVHSQNPVRASYMHSSLLRYYSIKFEE